MRYVSQVKQIEILNCINVDVKAIAYTDEDGDICIMDYIYELPQDLMGDELIEAQHDLTNALDRAVWIF